MDNMGAREIDMVMAKKSNLEVVSPEKNGHVSFLPRPASPGSPLLSYVYLLRDGSLLCNA